MMNLFCFSLEGSMDSLYEAVQNSEGPACVPNRSSSRTCSRSCSPAVLLDDSTKWRGSGRSISMEMSQTQGTNSKKKKRITHVSKSASDNEALDKIGCNPALQQAASSRDDLVPPVNIQKEELGKAKHRMEAKGSKGGRQSGTKKNEKAPPSQSARANGLTEPRAKPAVKRGQKGGKKTGTKNTKEGTKKNHISTVHSPPLPVIPTVGAPYLDLPYRPDGRPYTGKASTLPSQENATPGRGMDMRMLPSGATPTNYHQRWSNLAESSPAWGDTHALHTCRRPLTEYRIYSHDFTMPRGKDWEGKEHHEKAIDQCFRPDPKTDFLSMVPRSITDVDLSESNRSTSFGRFEGLRHQPSPVKPEENGTTGVADEGGSVDSLKPAGLGKKMKAISLTMRRKMAKKHAKSFSEEPGDETERDLDGETDIGLPGEKGTAKTSNSLESLHSGQSSICGVTSETNGSSLRDSLMLEEDGSCQIQFCGRARVHTDFVPSPYDTDSLKLKVGDIINVISKSHMGIWTGMLNHKVGNFKFIYVDVLVEKKEEEEAPKIRQQKLCHRPRPKTLLELLEKLNLEEYASALLLNGYQSVEDLLHLQEKHLIELNVKDPEHRQRLLTAANIHYTGDDMKEVEEHISSQSLQEEDSDCPRDSGCFIPAECKEDGDHLGDTVYT